MTKRVTIIDGKKIIVERCGDCPFYDGGDDGYGEHCNYPGGNRYPWENDRIFHYSEDGVGEDCPLLPIEVKFDSPDKVASEPGPCFRCGFQGRIAEIDGMYKVMCACDMLHETKENAIEVWNKVQCAYAKEYPKARPFKRGCFTGPFDPMDPDDLKTILDLKKRGRRYNDPHNARL